MGLLAVERGEFDVGLLGGVFDFGAGVLEARGAGVTVVHADVTSEAEVDALFAETTPSPMLEFSKALVMHYRGVRKAYKAPDNMLYVDPLAAAVVIDPSMITKSIHASSSVALAPGITRGMTLVDPSGRLGTPKITFVEEVDLAKVDALYAVSLAYVPTTK